MTGVIITMKVKRPCRFEDPEHLQHPDAHHNEIGFHGFSMTELGSTDDLIEFRFRVREFTVRDVIEILQCPKIFECCARGLTAY